jgi:hypothetical protein
MGKVQKMTNLANKVVEFNNKKAQLVADKAFEKQLSSDANKARMLVKFLVALVYGGAFTAIAAELGIFWFIWSKFFTTDILYLCSWFVILGCPIGYAIIDATIYITDLLKENLYYNIDKNTKIFRSNYYEKGV